MSAQTKKEEKEEKVVEMATAATIKWEMSVESANMCLLALSKLPYDQVADLLFQLRESARKQIAT